MTAPSIGQAVQFYPERGGQLADLNAIEPITPLNATIRNIGPTLKVQILVTGPTGRQYLVKNVPYFDSEYASRPYTNIIPGVGGYCVDPNDAPAFPPPKTVPYNEGEWGMPRSPINVPANPEDSAQPYVPVKIMANETGTPVTATETPVASDPE